MAPLMPYNMNYRILQTPHHVVIWQEMYHEVRIVPLSGSPRLDTSGGYAGAWLGEARGHWEGDTLVIETDRFNDQTWFDRAGNFHSAALHVVERYTPTGPDHLLYEATIEDPEVFTRPWTISMPLYRRQEANAELLEYQCSAYLLEQEWDNPESTLFEAH